jgi:hypothetical protein
VFIRDGGAKDGKSSAQTPEIDPHLVQDSARPARVAASLARICLGNRGRRHDGLPAASGRNVEIAPFGLAAIVIEARNPVRPCSSPQA